MRSKANIKRNIAWISLNFFNSSWVGKHYGMRKEIQYKNMIKKCEKINIGKINQWTQAKEKKKIL